MPRERKQRGHRQAEKRKLAKEEQERKFLESQERYVLFYNRPKHPFGMLTREDERFFNEVYEEFRKNEWDDEDAKEAFMQNVFVEMKGKELKIATSEVGRFLEMLLAGCPRKELENIVELFRGHAKDLARHRFGSFALEKVIGYTAIWLFKNVEETVVPYEEHEAEPGSLEKQLLEIFEELVYPEMNEIFADPFASHVYHTILNTLDGISPKNPAEDRSTKKRKLKDDTESHRTPASFNDLKTKYLNIVKSWDVSVTRTLAFDKYAVPTLQSLIRMDAPKAPKKKAKGKSSYQTFGELLIFAQEDESKESNEEFVNKLLRDTVGSRIMETVLQSSSPATIRLLFDKYFKERLIELAEDDAANFVLQRLLERLDSEEDVLEASEVLLPHAQDLILSSKVSVLTALMDACSRTNTGCDDARQSVQEVIHLLPHSSDNLWTSLMGLDENIPKVKASSTNPEDATNFETYPVSRFGTLIAASLLRLPDGDSYRVIEDLCDLESSAVLFYMKSPQTSYIIEQMLSPPPPSKIPVSLRRKLINHILGSVVELAIHPAGSHIIDACWNATNDIRHYRPKIVQEMTSQEDIVRNDFFGRRVWKNWNLDAYVSGRMADWERGGRGGARQFAKIPVAKKVEQKKVRVDTVHAMEKDKKSYLGKADGGKNKHFSTMKTVKR